MEPQQERQILTFLHKERLFLKVNITLYDFLQRGKFEDKLKLQGMKFVGVNEKNGEFNFSNNRDTIKVSRSSKTGVWMFYAHNNSQSNSTKRLSGSIYGLVKTNPELKRTQDLIRIHRLMRSIGKELIPQKERDLFYAPYKALFDKISRYEKSVFEGTHQPSHSLKKFDLIKLAELYNFKFSYATEDRSHFKRGSEHVSIADLDPYVYYDLVANKGGGYKEFVDKFAPPPQQLDAFQPPPVQKAEVKQQPLRGKIEHAKNVDSRLKTAEIGQAQQRVQSGQKVTEILGLD